MQVARENYVKIVAYHIRTLCTFEVESFFTLDFCHKIKHSLAKYKIQRVACALSLS